MNIEIWSTSVIIPNGYRLGVNIGGRDFRFTVSNLKSKVDINHYLKNPKLILGMVRALPMNQLFKILTHEKVWAGNAMYTHNMDMKQKSFPAPQRCILKPVIDRIFFCLLSQAKKFKATPHK